MKTTNFFNYHYYLFINLIKYYSNHTRSSFDAISRHSRFSVTYHIINTIFWPLQQ